MATIWKRPTDLAGVVESHTDTIMARIGIEVIEFGPNFVRGRMPANAHTHQPQGLLHGGASVVLAETLGSIGANYAVDDQHYCVGLEVNANHLRAVRDGWVEGIATAVHIGGKTQVWEIHIRNQAEQLVCTSRLTMAVLRH